MTNNNIIRAVELKKSADEYRDNGRLNLAIDNYRKAISLSGNYWEAHANLSMVLAKSGDYDGAVLHAKRAINIHSIPELHVNLGLIEHSFNNFDKAEDCYHKVIIDNPDLISAHINLGNTLVAQRKWDQSISSYESALDIDPDNIQALLNLASSYEASNNIDKSETLIDAVLFAEPDNKNAMLLKAVILRRNGNLDDAISILSKLVDDNLKEVHFELAKLYDIKKKYNTAYTHFSIGNKISSALVKNKGFDKDVYLGEIDKIASYDLSKLHIGENIQETNNSESPLFLVGFPRSGTTLLDQILSGHSRIQVMEEKPAIQACKQLLEKNGNFYLDDLVDSDSTRIHELRKTYSAVVSDSIDRDFSKFLIDKFPLNIIDIPLILRLFPKCKIILALRHPCDVVLSNFMQDFKINNAMANFYNLEDAALLYRKTMGLWMHYISILNMKFHIVRYESIVDDIEKETRLLLDFIGVEWEQSVLDYHKRSLKKRINTPSYQSVSKPIYSSSRFRWKNYRTQLEDVCNDFGDLISELGYS